MPIDEEEVRIVPAEASSILTGCTPTRQSIGKLEVEEKIRALGERARIRT
jgi:hypothetical protein